ncbi:MAG: hypothetical protein V3S01_06175 [Dehalococcoidia bacterium]
MPLTPGGDLAYIPDHDRLMLDRTPLQFHKPRITALIRALALGVQCLEESLFGMHISTSLPNATGDALDQWGSLVGERRGGLDDDDYRVFIEAKLLVLRSNGSPDELIEIFRRITAPQISVRFALYPRASFGLWVLREEAMGDRRARRVGEFMRQAKPGGTEMWLVESIPGYFGFKDDPGHPGVPEDSGDSLGWDEGRYSRVL